MKKRKDRKYTLEFKKSSAKLAATSDQPVTQTAKELGVNENTLHGWVNKYYPRSKTTTTTTLESEHEGKIKELQKKLSKVTQQRDILKKAVAYFAIEM